MTTTELLHAAWCSLTEQELHFRATERLFHDFSKEGFLESDLRCVIHYMQNFNRKNGAKYRLQVHKVIGDLAVFASICAEAKAQERNRRQSPTPKEQVLAMRDPLLKTEEADPRINGAGRHLSDVLKTIQNQ